MSLLVAFPRNISRWISVRDLEKISVILEKHGLEVSRHAYSYRLLYNGKIVGSIHLYPGYEEVSIRLYKHARVEAEKVRDLLVDVVKKVFPHYRIYVNWYPPR